MRQKRHFFPGDNNFVQDYMNDLNILFFYYKCGLRIYNKINIYEMIANNIIIIQAIEIQSFFFELFLCSTLN
jgi:hypothetical protein